MKRCLAIFVVMVLIFTTSFSNIGVINFVSATTVESDNSSLTEVTSPYSLLSYDGIVNYKNNISDIENISISDSGVDGSYGLEIKGDGAYAGTYLRFDENIGTKFLTSEKTYTMKLKARTDNGINSFKYGIRMHGDFFTTSLLDNDLTSEWKEFSYTFTPTTTATNYWVHMYIEYIIPENSTLYIDDIVVFETDDETQTNLFKKGNFDSLPHYESAVEKDNIICDYSPNKITNYNPSWTGNGTDIISNLETVSISEKDGVNNSCALKLSQGNYTFFSKFADVDKTETAYFRTGETYRFALKAKKIGDVENFSFKFKTTSGWVAYTLITAEVTDEWVYYAFDMNFDDYGITGAGNKHWGISCSVGENSYLLIDDVEIRNINDTENYYSLGSFDTITHSYEPFSLSEYRHIETDSETGKINWNSWDNGTNIKDSDLVQITQDGVDNTYALKITGDGTSNTGTLHQIALNLGESTLSDSTTYTINFDARVSTAKALKIFEIGTMKRWSWSNQQKAIAYKNPSLGISAITTEWKSFSGECTTTDTYNGNYNYIFINYQLPAGAVLYIDNITLTDENGNEYFYQGIFERKTRIWNRLEGEARNATFTPKYIDDYSEKGFNSEIIPIDSAISGNNVLAMGMGENATNGRVNYDMTYIRPGETYKLEMYVMYVGDVTSSSIVITDNDPGSDSDYYNPDNPRESTVLYEFNLHDKYGERDWKKIEALFTDKTTSAGPYNWSNISFKIKGAPGSGMLIDSVSITPLSDVLENLPNVFVDSGFEYDLPEVTWSDKFYGESLTDYSFMNNLPKTMGELGNGLKTEYQQYKDIITEIGDFSYLNMAFIHSPSIEIALYETRDALKNNKEIWLDATYIVSYGIDEFSGAVYDDWKDRLDKIAYNIQAIAGDNFQGVYFDEPHLKFRNNDEFIMVTKYIRENYKKRVFSMAKHDMFYLNGSANVKITAESHAYVTDIGYWNYSSDGMASRASWFNTAVSRLSPDVRKWVCCLMGQYGSSVTEETNINMFTYMLNSAKSNNNFGGIMLWDAYDTDGYGMLKTNEDGTVLYNNYRELLTASSMDLKEHFSWIKSKYAVSDDNVIVLDNADTSAKEFISSFNTTVQNYISINLNGTGISDDSKLANTSATLKATAITSDDVREYQFTLSNDVNGDNIVNAADIVRAKKISAGISSATVQNYAAAGTDSKRGISAINISAIRDFLLK